MSTYVFGDLQGCYDEFQQLLEQTEFNPNEDQLWFTGDLVNRGPKNLETLQFIMDLDNPVIVLGNHDLHFLAVATGTHDPVSLDTIDDLLSSHQLPEIIDWMRRQPLLQHDEKLHHDKKTGFLMVHAGVPPHWNLPTCLARAREVESVLSGPDYRAFLEVMYGNEPSQWDDHLQGIDRLRIITNYFTRLRYCTEAGDLELTHKTSIRPKGYSPWFEFPRPEQEDNSILFGHWAAIEGVTGNPGIIALDTGCVWGRSLTALRLEDGALFSTPAIRSA